MTTRSPTAGSQSLRDRIAKFETKESLSPNSPVLPRIKTGVNGKVAALGRKMSAASLNQEASALKTPITPSDEQTPSDSSKTMDESKNVIVDETIETQPNTTATVVASPKIQPLSVTVPPSLRTTSSESSSLDALLSPVQLDSQEVYTHGFVRQSPREDEDSDIRFSTIPLSGKTFDEEGNCQPSFSSLSSGTPSIDDLVLQESNYPTHLKDNSPTSLTHKQSVNSRKKDSRSSLTTVPFLMNRLDKQEEMNDMTLGANRQLQEEFTRIQKQKANADPEAEAQQIDWGQCMIFNLGISIETVPYRLLGCSHGRYGVHSK